MVCANGRAQKRQRLSIEVCRQASEVTFTALGSLLEAVSTFKYLGRPLSSSNSDWPALYKNLKKARQRWGRVSRILSREGASPKVSAMFYKAIVQSVLLYGSETWTITERMRLTLQGFHHRVARRLTGKMPRLIPATGEWEYPPIGEALNEAGMETIDVYIKRRPNRLAEYVALHPVFDLCMNSTRETGSSPRRKWWWTQSTPAQQ